MSATPHLLHVFSTFAPGGPQVRTTQLMAAFGGAYRHSVIAMDGCLDARDLVPPELEVHYLDSPPKTGTATMVGILRRQLKAERADALLTYNWGSIEAVMAAVSMRTRRRLHHEDGFRPDEAGGFKRRRVATRRWLLRGAPVMVPSATLERIATDIWRLPPERVHLIPNGIHAARFGGGKDEAPGIRTELGIPAGAKVIGAVGHLRGEKNFVRLVHAFAGLEDEASHLLILGEGAERSAIEQAVADSNTTARVHLPGHREQLAPYYAAMDAFAISSDTEQMPVALLEAMASGLPVASTNVGDVVRMLPEDQRRFVVGLDSNDPAGELRGSLSRLLQSAELRRDLGAQNRAHVESNYSFESMVDAYRNLYDSVLQL